MSTIRTHLFASRAAELAKMREIGAKLQTRLAPDAAKALSTGYWWCYTCQARVQINDGDAFNKCTSCSSPRIRWFAPIS